MRKAFTLLEFTIACAIVTIICAIAIPNIIAIRKEKNNPERIEVNVSNSTYTVHKFDHEGHQYFFFNGNHPGFSVVHNPNCKCLKPLESTLPLEKGR
jgi:competence protein ComGC